MQTFTGKQFWPMDPRSEDVCIEDIAHALSNMCRYNGHCTRFYSVAEHSVMVAAHVSKPMKPYALLHDASEAYIADIVRPAKRFLTNYEEVERYIQRAIFTHFDLNPDVRMTEVVEADRRILVDEKAALMVAPPVPWHTDDQPLGVDRIAAMSPTEIEPVFMAWARAYGLA